MRKPNESLDDYVVTRAPGGNSEPPRVVSLRRTGKRKVLKPLTRMEVRAEPARTVLRAFHPSQPLWFRRFLAVGSGAIVMIALVLVGAILLGIDDPAAGPDIAISGELGDTLTQPAEPFSFDVLPPSVLTLPTGGVRIVSSNTGRRSARPRIHRTSNKFRRHGRMSPPEPKFVPTTLVIYVENGVINTRIEPWLQADNKRMRTFNN